LRSDFALFLRLPEGSLVGAWYGGGVDVANPPIVVIGSEGQTEIVAASLDSLLARIALGWFDENDTWTDFAPHEDMEDDATAELASWLCKRLGVNDLESLTEMPPGLPDFARWTEKWCQDREQFWSNHPAMNKLAQHLIAYQPEGANPWDKTAFEVAIAGNQYQVRVLRGGWRPIDEANAIEPILRGLRDEMWQAHSDLGLWYSMSFGLYADGRVLPSYFDYEMRPTIGETPAHLIEAEADLRRAPRPERWIPKWLKAT
jgi:hypothetical protein